MRSYHKNRERTRKTKRERKKGKTIDHTTERRRRQNRVAAFLCTAEWINETAPKWTAENNFFKVFQILALKCGTGLTSPEKLLYSSSKGTKATVWFQRWRWRQETNTKRNGYRFRGRGRNVSKQQWVKHSTYFALQSLYLNIWSCLNSELHQLHLKWCYFV